MSALVDRIAAVLKQEFTASPPQPGLTWGQYLDKMTPYVAARIAEEIDG